MHERTIRRAIVRGDLPATKRDGVHLISEEALANYLTDRAQVAHPLALTHPPAEGLRISRGFLPVPPTPLIGRNDDVARGSAVLADARVRLLTLTGPGGVGKTRLALAIAQVLAPHMADGVAYVPLETVRDPQLVGQAIASALGVPEADDRPLVQTLCDAVRHRRNLLVLDNFEQVLLASDVVAALLAAGPNLHILVTSREALRLRGEHEQVVPPLALPDLAHVHDSGTINAAPAVALFVQRAQAVSPDFALSDANTIAVAAICQHLDGLPLAIELAAAHIKHASPTTVLRRLASRLDVLTGGARDLPHRLQTMRAAIAWSYDLLAPSDQAFFQRLAVFSGGFDGMAAASVTADLYPASAARHSPSRHHVTAITNRLNSLVDKSLLRQEGSPDEPNVYRMLETIREYAGEQLAASGDESATRAVHATHFLAMAEHAADAFHGAAEGWAFAHLEADLGNYRAALAWASHDDGDTGCGLGLVNALWWFWYVRGYYQEGWQWTQTMLARPDADAWPSAQAYAVLGAGWFATRTHRPTEAQTLHSEALARFRHLGDARGAAFATGGLAFDALFGEGDPLRARVLMEDALAGYEAVGDRWLEASGYYGLALTALALGDLETARILGETGLALSREDGDAQGLATTMATLGRIARGRGDIPAALNLLHGALENYQRVNDRGNVCATIETLAGLSVLLGRAEQAAWMLGAAASLRDAIGTPVQAHERPQYDADLKAVRFALGPTAFAAAWEVGQAVSLDEALGRAVWSGNSADTTAPTTAGHPLVPLTQREREVLHLVAAGHTDREIGRMLAISPTTVTKHVGHVLRKLQAPSRTAAAVIAVLAGLL